MSASLFPDPAPPRRDPLPVTLVGGFLGAGKTSLIAHQLLAHPEANAATLVMGPTDFCPDASLLRAQLPVEAGARVIEVRDDDPEQRWQDVLPGALTTLAQSPAIDHLFVEVSGRMQLQAVMKVLPAAAPGLGEHNLSARIYHLACVIDGLDFYHRVVRPTGASQAIPNTPLQRLLAAQARTATHVLVNKGDMLTEEQLGETIELLQLINPTARLAVTAFGQAPADFLNAAAVDMGRAMETGPLPNAPSPKETSILPPTFTRAQLFTARRPLHPRRFWDLWSEGWPPVMRTKGHYWVASRMACVGALSQSFASFTCGLAGHWWAVLPPEAWPEDETTRAEIDAVWQEPFGDRRQQLLIEGEPGPVTELHAALTACLLTDDEMNEGPDAWEAYDDPWPEWELDEDADAPL